MFCVHPLNDEQQLALAHWVHCELIADVQVSAEMQKGTVAQEAQESPSP